MTARVVMMCVALMAGGNAYAINPNEAPYRTEYATVGVLSPMIGVHVKQVAKKIKGKPTVLTCHNLSLAQLKLFLPYKADIRGFELEYCPKITSLNGFSAFSNIEIMKIRGNLKEWDLSELAKMKKLKVLILKDLKYTSLEFLKPLKQLEELVFLNTPRGFTDLSWTKDLKKLRVLKFNGMRGADLTPLTELTNLELLSLWGVFPKSLAPLSKLKKLKWLDAKGVSCDLSVIGGLPELRYLSLSWTRKKDYQFLAKLDKLEGLDLSFSSIPSLTPILGMQELKEINLENAKNITSIMDLLKCGKLKSVAVSLKTVSAEEIAKFEKAAKDRKRVVSVSAK